MVEIKCWNFKKMLISKLNFQDRFFFRGVWLWTLYMWQLDVKVTSGYNFERILSFVDTLGSCFPPRNDIEQALTSRVDTLFVAIKHTKCFCWRLWVHMIFHLLEETPQSIYRCVHKTDDLETSGIRTALSINSILSGALRRRGPNPPYQSPSCLTSIN